MYRKLEILTIALPPLLIGGFEFIRHMYLLPYISMKTGNYIITVLTLALSFLYTKWVFRIIRRQNKQLAKEQAHLAVYEERERLARELHDGIAQTLFFLNVKLKQGHIEEARNAVAMIDNHVRQAIFNVRSIPDVASGSFPARLEQWLEQWSALTGIEVEHELANIPEGFFTSTQEVQLFSIIQEAFHNIRKHSHAQNAFLRLQTKPPSDWELEIRDDGVGIDRENVSPKQYGISMMADRAQVIGAQFEIKTGEPSGTVLRLMSPRGGNS